MTYKIIKRMLIYYLASIVLICVIVLFGVLRYQSGSGHPMNIGKQETILIIPAVAMLLFFIFLLIGIGVYVYHDAKARGMNGALWALVAVFGPYFIGLIVFLLVRKPLLLTCPTCKALAKADAAYCPTCGHELKPKCTKCAATVDAGSRFCPACGTAIERKPAE